jgi:hypothetical protein
MSNAFRRYEILLPLRHNDGSLVPDEIFGEALLELRQRFGYWQQEGQLCRDERTRVFVDVADTPENSQFFLEFKERLKTQFRQIDIWMTTHPIEKL